MKTKESEIRFQITSETYFETLMKLTWK